MPYCITLDLFLLCVCNDALRVCSDRGELGERRFEARIIVENIVWALRLVYLAACCAHSVTVADDASLLQRIRGFGITAECVGYDLIYERAGGIFQSKEFLRFGHRVERAHMPIWTTYVEFSSSIGLNYVELHTIGYTRRCYPQVGVFPFIGYWHSGFERF